MRVFVNLIVSLLVLGASAAAYPDTCNPLDLNDFDGDGIGDSCDLDDDNDLVVDTSDFYPNDYYRFLSSTPESEYNDERDFANDFSKSVSGTLSINTDVDWYRISINSGDIESVLFDARTVSSGLGFWQVSWFSPSMQELSTRNISKDDGIFVYTLPFYEDGTYFVRVRPTFPGNSSFHLSSRYTIAYDVAGLLTQSEICDGLDYNQDGIFDTDVCEQAPEDNDQDGVDDSLDNCPSVSNEDQADFDADGDGDACDIDDDNDGSPDVEDAFPLEPAASVDTDGDGQPDDWNDNATELQIAASGLTRDDDDDGDGVSDDIDPAPLDPTVSGDQDGDGVSDATDNCPSVANEDQADFDADGEGDSCDSDDDNDGSPDTEDAFPREPAASVDTDGDGQPDDWNDTATDLQIAGSGLVLDSDDDGDGVPDDVDLLPSNPYFSDPALAAFSDSFGGAYFSSGFYVVPSSADNGAGFTNTNTGLYPFSFEYGGQITFTAAVPLGGSADISFRFENMPSPNNDVSFETDVFTITNISPESHVVSFPSQGLTTFSSLLMFVHEPDQPVIIRNVSVVSLGDTGNVDDADLDGVPDSDDAFPTEIAASIDTDMDGLPDDWNEDASEAEILASGLVLDDDDDGDGTLDAYDPSPRIANNFVIDTDNDGIADYLDAYPNDPSKQFSGSDDLDGDGWSNDDEVDYCTNPFSSDSQPEVGGLNPSLMNILINQT